MPVAHGTREDLPGYDAPTFTLIPVGYTSQRPVQVSGFDDIGRLAPLHRLISASCSSGQRFAFSFLQIRSYPRHPCRSANSSPCRASRGLSPPSECALTGAPRKRPIRGLACGIKSAAAQYKTSCQRPLACMSSFTSSQASGEPAISASAFPTRTCMSLTPAK